MRRIFQGARECKQIEIHQKTGGKAACWAKRENNELFSNLRRESTYWKVDAIAKEEGWR